MGRRRWIAAATAAGAVLALALPGGARPADTDLPPPTLSSTDLQVGDVITVSGTGCVDPDTRSGEGLSVSASQSIQDGRPWMANTTWLAVRADGSYEGTWTIAQPLWSGPLPILVACQTTRGVTISQAEVAVVGHAPRLPDLVVTPGATVPFAYPCPESGYSFDIGVPGAGNALVPSDDGLGSVGQTMHLPVPSNIRPGTYEGQVVCNTEVIGFYFGLRVTVTAPGASPSAPASPATPAAGTADYTG